MDLSSSKFNNQKEMSARNPAIDIAKYVAAILVVAIHTHPFKVIWPVFDFVFVEILCRFAVPFFAVCTGYYLAISGSIKRSFMKIAKLYCLWSLVYLVYLFYVWRQNNLEISWLYLVGWFEGAMCSFSFYHLWYLNAMCWGLFAWGLVSKFVHEKYYTGLAICLWILQVLVYVYDGILNLLPGRLMTMVNLFTAPFNGVTMMLPFLIVGWTLKRYLNGQKIRHTVTGLIVCLICLAAEIVLLRMSGARKFSFILFTLPSAYFVFAYVYSRGVTYRYNNIPQYTKRLAAISLTVYCIHPVIIGLITLNSDAGPMVQFILTAAVATILALSYNTLSIKLSKRYKDEKDSRNDTLARRVDTLRR